MAPPVKDVLDLKYCCYGFFSDLLVEHASLFSYAELVPSLGSNIISSSYNSTLEVADCCDTIHSAFFQTRYLIPLGFCDRVGAKISSGVTYDVLIHPSGVAYFAFCTTVYPSYFDPRLSILPYSFDS